MTNQTNPIRSTQAKNQFANLISQKTGELVQIAESLGINPVNFGVPELINSRDCKTDVRIVVDTNREILVRIKLYGETGFNQIERCNFSNFCNKHGLSSEETIFLQNIWLRKANNPDGLLVFPNEEDCVRKIFSRIQPGINAMLGTDTPNILAILNESQQLWQIYNMDNQVIPHICCNYVKFTEKSSNIQISDFIFIQRRGAEGGDRPNDPSNIENETNDVQVKMKIGDFYNNKNISPICTINFF